MTDIKDPKVYRLNSVFSNYSGYNKLLNLYSKAIKSKSSIILFSITSFFNANLVAVLGSLLEKISDQKKEVSISFGEDKNIDILKRNGFLYHYGYGQIKDSKKTTIPFLKIPICD